MNNINSCLNFDLIAERVLEDVIEAPNERFLTLQQKDRLCSAFLSLAPLSVRQFIYGPQDWSSVDKVKRIFTLIGTSSVSFRFRCENFTVRGSIEVIQRRNSEKIRQRLAKVAEDATEIDLSRLGLTFLSPAEINRFKNLKKLNLSVNFLYFLSPQLDFSNLEELDLTRTTLQTWPESLHCPKLKKLYVNKTSLLSIPENLRNQLEVFEYVETPLETIETAIQHLRRS